MDAVGHSKSAFVTKDQFMLNKKIALLGAAMAAMVSTGANAAQVTATAEVEILAPVTLTETVGLDFGIVAAGSAAGTVTIGTGADTASCSVGLACVGTAARGTFEVVGADTTVVEITVDASTTLSNGTPADDMNLTLSPSVATITADGTAQTFYVGGVLSVAASQTAGTYTGNYDVSAEYQ
jgi:Mat/Ecp fimbriae major subunit